MNKNLFKIGALALGMFAFGVMFYTNAEERGEITLTINQGTWSECTFSSFSLGDINMTFDETGSLDSFTSPVTWSCKDEIWGTVWWTYTIDATDLELDWGNGVYIANNNISLSYDQAVGVWDSSCQWNSTRSHTFWNNQYTLIERTTGGDGGLCSVALEDIAVEVTIPANQTPGSYQGDIILTTDAGFAIRDLNL